MVSVSLDVFDKSGKAVDKRKSNSDIFGSKVNNHTVFRSVCVFNANKRRATAKTKNRSEVRGGGRKPWRQKGTGRARAGSIRSPIWVGGGKVFTPTGNQNFKIKQNKKEHSLALKSVLTDNASLIKIIDINCDNLLMKKTSEVIEFFNNFNIQLGDKKNRVLFILEKRNDTFFKASKNIPFFKVIEINEINAYNVLNCDHIFITKNAIELLEKKLSV